MRSKILTIGLITSVIFQTVAGAHAFAMGDSLSIGEDNPTTISLEGVKDIYNGVEGDKVVVTADDADGIASLQVYINNEVKATATSGSVELDVSKYAYGNYDLEVVTYDTLNNKATAEKKFTVTGSRTELQYADDFSEFTGGDFSSGLATIQNGHVGINQGGYIEAAKFDDTHGNALVVGKKPNTSGDRAYVGISTGQCKSKATLKFDLYVYEETTDPSLVIIAKKAGTQKSVLEIRDGEFFTDKVQVPYKKNTWYTFTVGVDVPSKTFTLSINDGEKEIPVIAEGLQAGVLDKGFDMVEFVRIASAKNAGNGDGQATSRVAIDNAELYLDVEFPLISKVGYNGGDDFESVAVDPETIDVYLTSSVSDLQPEQVSVVANGSEIGVKEVVYDSEAKCIKITPESGLLSNTKYDVILKSGTMVPGGAAIDRDTISSFMTKLVGTDVKSVSYANGKVSYELQNQGDSQTVYLVTAVYNGDRFVKAAHEKITLDSNGMAEGELEIGGMNADEHAEVYLWRFDGNAPVNISSKIYTLK